MSMASRRSSYAAVLSGNNSATAPSYAQQVRAGLTAPQALPSPQRADLGRSQADAWDKPSLPAQSVHDTPNAEDRMDELVVPSYLRGSRHVELLHEKQRARRAAQREGKSARSSQPGSLSTSASNLSLPKMVPSHRGMTHEIIERPLQTQEEGPIPLPSRWSNTEKAPGLELSADGLEVKYTGPPKSPDEAASVRADYPMPKDCGIYYFEVTLQGKHKEGLVGIGFAGPKVSLLRLPGWEPDSWAYHGDDGLCFCQTASGKAYGPKYNWTATVGCGINFRTGTVFFTKDGVNLGTAFREIREPNLFPSIGMKKTGEHARVNFGQAPFIFDIDSMVEREKRDVQDKIEAEDPTGLHSSRDEQKLLSEMVSQYLEHEGYVETAKAFAREARKQTSLLQGEEGQVEPEREYHEDVHAIRRQQIRACISSGDINTALTLIDEYYPLVLRQNEDIGFKLKCRKFVEMIRQCSELGTRTKSKGGAGKNGKAAAAAMNGHQHHQAEFGVFDNEMEIDSRDDGMDVDINDFIKSQTLMTEALMYGQQLQAEFRDDPRREVKQALEDTFALIAYNNVEESSVAPLLREEGRIAIAEELNSAILVTLGKASSSAMERLVQQSEVLVGDLAGQGHGAAHINIRHDYMRPADD